MSDPLKIWFDRDGRLLRLRLARPKANIVDAAMLGALQTALDTHLGSDSLLAVLIDAEGPHFSFGASVEEHLPESCADMLKTLHKLVLTMVESPVPVLVAVQGQCLGGGLEVAMGGHLMFLSEDAQLGQPEIKLGVFAPAASCILPERMPRVLAEDMLYSGRSIGAAEAVANGLANGMGENAEVLALAWFDDHIANYSGATLRHAVTAARLGYADCIRSKIAAVETLYLEELMATRDAVEGLESFIAKRSVKWEHR